MEADRKEFEPWVMLNTRVREAGANLVEQVGLATGRIFFGDGGHKVPTDILDDMEKQARRALHAIECYRNAVQSDRLRFSAEAFEALAESRHG